MKKKKKKTIDADNIISRIYARKNELEADWLALKDQVDLLTTPKSRRLIARAMETIKCERAGLAWVLHVIWEAYDNDT